MAHSSPLPAYLARGKAHGSPCNPLTPPPNPTLCPQVRVFRYRNATLAGMYYGSPAETALKVSARRGGARDLNLYLAQPSDGVLGYSTFPWLYQVRGRGTRLPRCSA